jgi:LmbE family N-acetylglucosaminyl deacetylase
MTKRVLVIAAHPDDELLGLGGTIVRHLSCHDQVTFLIMADASSVRYDAQAEQSLRHCALVAAGRLGVSDVRFAGMADQRLDTLPILDVTQHIERVLEDLRPQILYTHFHGDINRDHQIVYEASLTATRPYAVPYLERILCYEAPSATEWAGPQTDKYFIPNVYIDITHQLDIKLTAFSAYTTELRSFPHPRSLEALRNRAVYWGSVIGVAAAEPFVLIRETQRAETIGPDESFSDKSF